MSKNTQKQKATEDSVGQIRDILFGEQIKIFENKFSQLEENLTSSINQLSSKVDKAIKDLSLQIENTSSRSQSDTNELAKQQSQELQTIQSALNNKIIETESDLINQIQTGLEKLETKASHRNELAQLLNDMADKLAD
ncbi:MAG: hypothetical protein AB8B80_01650 [Marinicellaceae bacterium]